MKYPQVCRVWSPFQSTWAQVGLALQSDTAIHDRIPGVLSSLILRVTVLRPLQCTGQGLQAVPGVQCSPPCSLRNTTSGKLKLSGKYGIVS